MFGYKNAVLEMPADSSASAGGGSLGYAGFWARFAAVMVDSAIVMIIGIALMIVLGMAMGAAGVAIGNIIFFFLQLLYWPVMESSARQATFGKSLMGLQVTDLDGNRTSFIRALLRNLGKIISSMILGIGFLLAAFTARKQALHDIITSCLVVRTGPSSFLKAVVVAVLALVLVIGASYYYFSKVYMPQQMDHAMKGAGKDFQRDMEKAMKDAGKDMARDMERAMKDAQKGQPAMKAAPPPPVAVPKPADTPPVAQPAQQVVAEPGAQPAPKSAPPAPEKPAAVALAPAKPTPAPAKKVEAAPKRVAQAAPSDGDKPKAKRRAAPSKPAAAPSQTAMAPAEPPKTPKYNDVMTAVLSRDRAGAAEALDAGFWADRRDSNGVTPLMAAAMNGDTAMVQLLLKHGANPNLSGPGGSVLSYASRGGDGKLVELLRKTGAR